MTRLTELIAQLEPTSIFILVDTHTEHHCLPILKGVVEVLAKAEVITISAGEENKSLASCEIIWDRLLQARADRKALLINLGGGMITDLGGFAAACYKRGIRFVNVPTTLLGQVDASLGGKTGVDFGGLKNSVGVFAQAEEVITNTSFLKTLPPRELRSGMAEMFKHALIDSPQHWEALKACKGQLLDQPNAEWLITQSQQIKLDIVASDPLETGLRGVLNLGHTIGHAIESVLLTSTNPALHGEAVAAGLICEAYISEELCALASHTVRDIEQTLLSVYGKLTLRANHLVSLLALIANDKKNLKGSTRMTLLKAIGEPQLSVRVDQQIIESALERYAQL